MADVTIAPATDDDVRALARRRNADETTVRLALQLADCGMAWMAHDRSEPIAAVFTHASDEERYVGDLFVEPSFRNSGIAGQLLDAAFADAGDAARRMLVEPQDGAALVLALRRGLAPQTAVLSIAGPTPREDALLAMAAGDYRFQVDALDPIAHGFALNALDRETRGTTRSEDHARFAQEAAGLAVFLDGEFVAYAYVWPSGRVGPVAASSAQYLTQIFAYAIVTLQRTFGASWCTALIPGDAVRLLRAVLRSGLRIERALTLAGDAPLPDPSRYVAFHPLVF
jgi:GNAT superfamily N-acetyltransferase